MRWCPFMWDVPIEMSAEDGMFGVFSDEISLKENWWKGRSLNEILTNIHANVQTTLMVLVVDNERDVMLFHSFSRSLRINTEIQQKREVLNREKRQWKMVLQHLIQLQETKHRCVPVIQICGLKVHRASIQLTIT